MKDEEHNLIREYLKDKDPEEVSFSLLEEKFEEAGYDPSEFAVFLDNFKSYSLENSFKLKEIIVPTTTSVRGFYSTKTYPSSYRSTQIGNTALLKWAIHLNSETPQSRSSVITKLLRESNFNLNSSDLPFDYKQFFKEVVPVLHDILENQLKSEFTNPDRGNLEDYLIDAFIDAPPINKEFKFSRKNSKGFIFYGAEDERSDILRKDDFIENCISKIYSRHITDEEVRPKFEKISDILISKNFHHLLDGKLGELAAEFSEDFLRDKLYLGIKRDRIAPWFDYSKASKEARNKGRLDLAAEFLEKSVWEEISWTNDITRTSLIRNSDNINRLLLDELKEPFKLHCELNDLKSAVRIFTDVSQRYEPENYDTNRTRVVAAHFDIDNLNEEFKNSLFEKSAEIFRQNYDPSLRRKNLIDLHSYFKREIDENVRSELILDYLDRKDPKFYPDTILQDLKLFSDPKLIERVEEIVQTKTLRHVENGYTGVKNSSIYYDISTHFNFKLDESFYRSSIGTAEHEIKYENGEELQRGLDYVEPLIEYLRNNGYSQELSTKAEEIVKNGKNRKKEMDRDKEVRRIFD